MQLKLKTELVHPMMNTLRLIALTQLSIARPIAVKVGDNSSILSAGDTVIEDMIEFCSKLSEHNFGCNTDKELISITVPQCSTLYLSDLTSDEISLCNSESASEELLHTLQTPVDITILFRNSTNVHNSFHNTEFLENNHVPNLDSFTVLNSRHCKIANFRYKILKQMGELSLVELCIDSFDGTPEEEIYKQCVELIKKNYSESL